MRSATIERLPSLAGPAVARQRREVISDSAAHKESSRDRGFNKCSPSVPGSQCDSEAMIRRGTDAKPSDQDVDAAASGKENNQQFVNIRRGRLESSQAGRRTQITVPNQASTNHSKQRSESVPDASCNPESVNRSQSFWQKQASILHGLDQLRARRSRTSIGLPSVGLFQDLHDHSQMTMPVVRSGFEHSFSNDRMGLSEATSCLHPRCPSVPRKLRHAPVHARSSVRYASK